MIISASRRTDIPAYYTEWMVNRINEGFVYVRNPMNNRQVNKINLDPEAVDCIVFWSKNPKPMLDKIKHFNNYTYYFQFTLNPYYNDIEKNLPPKDEIIETFIKLSGIVGPQRIIWRYDPILLNNRYTINYHIEKFEEFALQLKGFSQKVTISFIDFYKKIDANLKSNNIIEISYEDKIKIAESFSKIAKDNNFLIDTCAEDIELSQYNIGHAKCIDDKLIEKITGNSYSIKKDKNQRLECGCVSSVDIGEYNSCLNTCIYCYANNSRENAAKNNLKHNKLSPLLIGEINNSDIINERKVVSSKTSQRNLLSQ